MTIQNKNDLLINPISGDHIFGYIPFLSKVGFESGPIYLKAGDHWAPTKGFGAKHIWERHQTELVTLGFKSIDDVPAFLVTIILPGTQLYCEFNDIKGNPRLAALRTRAGVAFIERQIGSRNEVYYSVVTAFTKGKANGTLVGAVCDNFVAR